ncbi:GNAT family N-acetyltransferase [Streptococcus sp.]|uniref:GNAT family N-acetyltransferase n=1 Tax=Streptococcus sp. TaxID=1306 RepID=UPI002584D6B5|nr:GNAT family N-acetyltransferase [Streptococcus sp.]MCQ2962732.1 GNAT family N-acetyltransferase [Streptococcus sp.]
MQLRRPELSDKEAVIEMMKEFEASQSAHDGGFWSVDNFAYEKWLEDNRLSEMGINIPDTFVPAVQFVSFSDDGRALGFLHLRLRLNDNLLKQGGHIGYSIRPLERRKGYAKEQLHLGLLEAKKKNIKKALVTCHDDNPGSRKVILANGGVLEDVQNSVERYWISLEN